MAKDNNLYSSPLCVVEQFFFCGVPLRLDTYSGCSFNCAYCFARAIEIGHSSKAGSMYKILPADLRKIKRLLAKTLTTEKSADITVEWLRHKIPIHWGGMSDPFQPIEKRHRVSFETLKYLNEYQYPTVISTKGTMFTEPTYLSLIKEGKYAMQVTLISSNDNHLKKLEADAPLATERLKAMEVASLNGIWVACRIQPLIPASFVEREVVAHIQRLASVGVKHIVVEGYKPPVWNPEGRKVVDEICGGEVEREFKVTGAIQNGMEILLPTWRKWEYLQPILETAHNYGITVGAADNDLRDMGDVECCCGIDHLAGFENFWTYQTARMATIAKEKGLVRLSDLNNLWTGRCKFNFNKQGLTMEGNTRVRETVKYYVDKVWQWGDQRSANYLVNMTQTLQDGETIYKYQEKISKLKEKVARQGVLIE